MEERKTQQDNRFLKGRQIPHMMYDNFKTSGTGKALLDFNDLLSVQLKNENLQGLDTKWDEVLLTMTTVPDEDILETLHQKQLHFSEELLCICRIQSRTEKRPAILDGKKWSAVTSSRKERTRVSVPAVKTGTLQGEADRQENPRKS